jgi:hypothetical protein
MEDLTVLELIVNFINEMTTEELVQLNNEYCQSANYSDSEIYENDEEFFNLHFENRPFEVARASFYGDYNFSHDYVRFNGYGNLESLNYFEASDLVETVQNIAEYANDNRDDFSSIDFDSLED